MFGTDRICYLVHRMEVFGDQRPLAKEPIKIHDVLDHVRRLAENGVGCGMRFIEDYDPSLPFVPGNRDKLVQPFTTREERCRSDRRQARAGPHPDADLVSSGRTPVRPGVGHRISLPLAITIEDKVRAFPTTSNFTCSIRS